MSFLLLNDLINRSTFPRSIMRLCKVLSHRRKKVGIVLPVVVVEHCWTQFLLNIVACTLVTNIQFWGRGGIFFTFFLLSKLLNTVQYAFGPWSRSGSLRPRFLKYFSFALAIIFDVSFRTALILSQSSCLCHV